MQIRCTICGAKGQVREEWRGRSLTCIQCDGQFEAIDFVEPPESPATNRKTAPPKVAAGETVPSPRVEPPALLQNISLICSRCGCALQVRAAAGATFACPQCGAPMHEGSIVQSAPAATIQQVINVEAAKPHGAGGIGCLLIVVGFLLFLFGPIGWIFGATSSIKCFTGRLRRVKKPPGGPRAAERK